MYCSPPLIQKTKQSFSYKHSTPINADYKYQIHSYEHIAFSAGSIVLAITVQLGSQ